MNVLLQDVLEAGTGHGLSSRVDEEFRHQDRSPHSQPPKGDAADWLASHPEAKAADVLALACEQDPGIAPGDDGAKVAGSAAGKADTHAQAIDDPPNSCQYGGGRFELTQRGVLFIGTDNEGNKKAPVWVCSPLGVIAKTRDSKSGEWGRLLEWFDDDNVRHQWAMPLELLEGDGTDVRRELARLGLHIATGRTARDLLAAYIKVWPVDQRARCVERLGCLTSISKPFGRRVSGDVAGAGARVSGHGRCGNGHQPG